MLQPLDDFTAEFDRRFSKRLEPGTAIPSSLLEAVRYSALASGKRLRPYLVIECCILTGGDREHAWPAAFAIECVHAFSLIHDDLPAMDDDDLRRGQPTCHKKFGEATAILAGDALVVLAFELLAGSGLPAGMASALTLELARASGWSGMIGGQASDLEGEHQPPDLELVRSIHERKTASLIRAACRMGAIVGRASDSDLQSVTAFGGALGLAFQIADDLLDVSGDAGSLGKRVGKDAAHGKQTYPACVGVEESRRVLARYLGKAQSALATFGDRADALRELARFVGFRHS